MAASGAAAVLECSEYRCSACRKDIKNTVLKCGTCEGAFFHPGCAFKHKVVKDKELVRCEGPMEEISLAREERKTLTTSGTFGVTKQTTMDAKIDSLVEMVREIRDEVAGRDEVKKMIKHIIREEMENIKRELMEAMRGVRREMDGDGRLSYSEATGAAKRESILIVKPKREQKSEVTKQIIKEKVDIKNIPVGITRLRKGGKGSIILGCESEKEMKELKENVCEKLSEDFEIVEPRRVKPKLKIINVGEEEMKLEEGKIIATIRRQNAIDEEENNLYMRVVKKICSWDKEENRRTIRGDREGILIVEVDERLHERMLKREKINVGWKKCRVFDHCNVKRCFKCWGYFHIAANCTRQEVCHTCAGNHKSNECKSSTKKCINCIYKNRTYNLKIDEEHDALNRECPTYVKALEEEKKRTGWITNK